MGQGKESLFKNPLTTFSGTKGPMTLWLGMQHFALEPIKVYSNDDPRLTLTFSQQCQICCYAYNKTGCQDVCLQD